MATQQLVKRGLRWQVGDGRSIRIWQDQRLSTRNTYRVVTPERAGNQIKMVWELLRGKFGVEHRAGEGNLSSTGRGGHP